jgi:lipopolysaccharide export LptBFGC system permease protein LptF
MDTDLIVVPALLAALVSGFAFVTIMFLGAWKSAMRRDRLAVHENGKLHHSGLRERRYGPFDCYHECMTVSRWDDNDNSACVSMCGIRKD